MRILVSSLFALTLLYSCSRNDCNKDQYIDLKFQYSLDLIAISENGEDVFIDDKRDAINYLEVITGHSSQIKDLEYPLYQIKSQYLQDRSKWKQWYATHRCYLLGSEIDSLLLEYKSLTSVNNP